VRVKYIAWRNAFIPIADRTRDRLNEVNESIVALLTLARQLRLSVDGSSQVKQISTVRAALRSVVRGLMEKDITAVLLIGDELIAKKLKATSLFNMDELTQRIQSGAAGEQVKVAPPKIIFNLASQCGSFEGERLVDELGLLAEVELEQGRAELVIALDITTGIKSWRLDVARRARNCNEGEMAPGLSRMVEAQVNEYLDNHSSSIIDAPFILPQQSQVSFQPAGEIIEDSLRVLFRTSSTVKGFRSPPGVDAAKLKLSLSPKKQVAFWLSIAACAALISGILSDYENNPKLNTFFNEAWFHKWLGKNVVLKPDPNTNSFFCTIIFGAKYEDETAGQEWNVDITGQIPVRCTFEEEYGIDRVLKVFLRVVQIGGLSITSHQLHAGILTEVAEFIDKVSGIITRKINELKDNSAINIGSRFLLFGFKDAKDVSNRVVADGLVMELSFYDEVDSSQAAN
jgi:hypothetical protein